MRDDTKRHYCCSAKGFSISSKPSTGLRRVIVGPRKTARPNERTRGSGSTGAKVSCSYLHRRWPYILTKDLFLNIIEDQV